MPSATPTTMPTTVPLLMPVELTEPCPRVGSAVADAPMIVVLTWPVTVVTIVMACVATGVMLGDGDGLGLAEGLGLGVGVGDGDVTSVLACACATRVSTI
jgi:hypothetical protein